jgi:predicted methyltransferase
MTKRPIFRLSDAAAVALSSMLLACAPPDDAAAPPDVEAEAASIYADALAVPTRLAGDYERDASRKPAEVLAFFGIEPGMVVLDLFSGGGYYSELIAHVVGDDGHVDAHANEAYLNFVGDEFDARHADGRLPNVSVLMAENNELSLEAGRYDAITMILSYHDLYYDDAERGWPKFDVAKLNAELYEGLKPGGVLGVVDHQAVPGSPAESGNTVHRIDAAIVVEELTAAGFELEARSDVLHSAEDDHEKNVFNPDVRGKTDRFVLRFRKPR